MSNAEGSKQTSTQRQVKRNVQPVRPQPAYLTQKRHILLCSFRCAGTMPAMPNIASALKAEISRLARKELRAATDGSKKAISAYRHEIAELKHRMQALELEVTRLRKANGRAQPVAGESDDSPNLRFRAEGFAQHRRRLGLSAREVGLLIQASPLSVYKWEQGQARPRAKHLEAIAALRKIGKREAQKRLEELA